MVKFRSRYAIAFAVSIAAHAAILISAGTPPSTAMPSGAVRIAVSVSAPSETVPTRQRAPEVRETKAPDAKEAVTPDADAADKKPELPKPEPKVAETPPTPEKTEPKPVEPKPAPKKAETPAPTAAPTPAPKKPVKPEAVTPAAPPATAKREPTPPKKTEPKAVARRSAAAETRLTARRDSRKDASVKSTDPAPDPDAPMVSQVQPPKPMPPKPTPPKQLAEAVPDKPTAAPAEKPVESKLPPKPVAPPKQMAPTRQIARAEPEKQAEAKPAPKPDPKPRVKPTLKPRPKPKKVVEKPKPKAKTPVKTKTAQKAAPRRAPRAKKPVHKRAAAPLQRARKSKSRQVTAPNKTRTTELDKPARHVGKQNAALPGRRGHIPTMRRVRFLRPPRPAHYPKLSLERDEQGTVIIRALVGVDGRPQRVRVVRSSGYGRLDASAVQAVRGWAFVPMRVDGRASLAWVQIPVRFRIR